MSARYQLPPGAIVQEDLRVRPSHVTNVAWSPDGLDLAIGSLEGTVVIWNSMKRKPGIILGKVHSMVTNIAWSPDGRLLATKGYQDELRIWDTCKAAVLPCEVNRGGYRPLDIAWSPDGSMFAMCTMTGNVQIWDAKLQRLRLLLSGHHRPINSVAWSPDGRMLATGSQDRTVRIWAVGSGATSRTLRGHSGSILVVRWMPDGNIVATGAIDQTIRLWDPQTGKQIGILEGHTEPVGGLSVSVDGRVLASWSHDRTVRLWRCDTWDMTAVLRDVAPLHIRGTALAFHPQLPQLAVIGRESASILLISLDVDTLLSSAGPSGCVHYTNAKVVLVGDTSVGKTGLALVLTGHPFEPTESTHGRHVWQLSSEEAQFRDGRRGVRDTLLWDLAGQYGYRLIHRLHLHDAAVGLVVFDAQSETEPFAGVRYWARALDQSSASFPMVKVLVAARTDRGAPQVSRERISEVRSSLGFRDYFETSAKRGKGVDSLRQAIQDSILWNELPFVTTPETFARVKRFLLGCKERGLVLVNRSSLLEKYQSNDAEHSAEGEVFNTCLALLEAMAMIRRLSFGDLVLLQPEMLDNYCGWLSLTARDQPDGLGYVGEAEALRGDFQMDDELRIIDRSMEPAMLLVW